MSEYQVIIIGGGIGGAAAALRAAQYHLRTAWVQGDRETVKASRSRYVLNIDNMIGIHEGVVKEAMLQVLEPPCPEATAKLRGEHFHIGTQALIDNIESRLQEDYSEQVVLMKERATAAHRDGDSFRITTPSGTLSAPFVVLATGVSDRQPRVKKALPSGKTLDEIHWVFPYANQETFLDRIRCEGHLTKDTPTAVLGSSPVAGQVALMLHERYDTPVTLLTNGDVPDLPEKTRRLLDAYGIDIKSERLVNILGNRREGKLEGFELEGGDTVDVRFALVALGLHRVFNDLAVELGCELESGETNETSHVLVGNDSETAVTGCFAVGDMATHRDGGIRKQVYTAQEYAVRAVDTIDGRIRSARRAAVLRDP